METTFVADASLQPGSEIQDWIQINFPVLNSLGLFLTHKVNIRASIAGTMAFNPEMFGDIDFGITCVVR